MLKSLTLFTALALATSFHGRAEQPNAAMPSQLAEQNLLTDIVNIQGKLVAVGERGHIIFSKDGKQWQQANVPVNALLTAITFVDASTGFAVGHDVTLLKTTDGGENWQIVNYQPEVDKPLLNIKAFGQHLVAVGAYGLYWHSTDAGETWTSEFHDELLIEDDRLYLEDLKQFEPEAYDEEKQFMLPHFNDIAKVGDKWLLAGEAGFLAASSDQGEQWQLIEADYFGSYFSIADTTKGVQIGGLRGNLFNSNDMGESWSKLTTPIAATINDSFVQGSDVYHFANSGNVFYSKQGDAFQLHNFDDGKAIMSGVIKDGVMYLATEAGIKSLPVNKLVANK